MFRDLVKKASNMTAAAMENLQTPEKDGESNNILTRINFKDKFSV